MTFKEEMKERTEVIEKLLVKYLPKAEGYQSQIMEAMEYSGGVSWVQNSAADSAIIQRG